MANRFWVGGSLVDWDGTAGTKWSTTSGGAGGASLPTTADDVFIDDASSFDIVTGNTGCRTLTKSSTGTINVAAALTVAGGLSATSGHLQVNATITFSATTTGFVVNMKNADAFHATGSILIFDGAGGGWTLEDVGGNVNFPAEIRLTRGNITFAIGTTTVNAAKKFTSNNSNTRSITFNASSSFNLQDGGTAWDTSTVTGLTITDNGGKVAFLIGNPTVEAGSTTITLPSIDFLGSGSTVTLNNVNCNDLTVSTTTVTLADTNITIRGRLKLLSSTVLSGNTGTFTFTATSGTKTIDTDGLTVPRHFVFNGNGGTWNIDGLNIDELDLGTNNDLTLTAGTLSSPFGVTVPIICRSFSTGGGFLRSFTPFGNSSITLNGTGTVWNISTFSNLTSSDTLAIIVNNSSSAARTLVFGSNTRNWGAMTVTAGTGTLTVTNADVASLDFTGYSGQLQDGSFDVRGSLTISTGMTFSAGTGTITLTGTGTLTHQSKTFNRNLNINGTAITVTSTAGTLNLGTGTITLTGGTLDLSTNSTNLTCTAFSSSGSVARTLSATSRTITLTGTGTVWNTTTSTNLTLTLTSASIVSNSSSGIDRAIEGGGVTLPAVSITAGGGTFSTNGFTCSSLVWTGFTGVWSVNAITVNGNLTLPSGMATASVGTATLTLTGTSAVQVAGGVVLNFNVTIQGTVSITQFSFNIDSGHTFTLTSGSFNATSASSVTCGRFVSSNANVRTLTMGSITWSLASTAITTIWDLATTTNLTFNVNISTIKLTGSTANTRTFAGGGLTYNNIWINNPTAAGRVDFTGSNTFGDFRSDTIAQQIRFTGGTTTTVTTWSVQGSSGNVITLDTVSGTGTFTLAKSGGGFVGAKFHSVARSTASPVNTWYADSNSTDGGTNTNWIFGDNITVDCRQYIDYFVTRNKRNYFLVVPGVQFIFNPDNETDANDNFTDTGQTADATKASLRTHIKLFTF